MNFKDAFKAMKEGKKVKLPSWAGYWAWEDGTIMMHCKDGAVIDLRDTKRPEYTFGNMASDDFVIADEDNCPELGGVAIFDFSEALKYLKRGMRVTRKDWRNDEMYLKLILPGDACCDHYPMQPCIGLRTADCNMQPGWVASQADMLANDWMFAERFTRHIAEERTQL